MLVYYLAKYTAVVSQAVAICNVEKCKSAAANAERRFELVKNTCIYGKLLLGEIANMQCTLVLHFFCRRYHYFNVLSFPVKYSAVYHMSFEDFLFALR